MCELRGYTSKTCHSCRGRGFKLCKVCDATGEAPLHECPSKLLDNSWRPFMTSYGDLMKYNAYPERAGTQYQSAWWSEAVAVAEAERAKLKEENDEVRRRESGRR